MILNTVVAQSMANIAETLGLPASQKQTLIDAIISIEFNNTNLTLAQEIWRDAQLDHADLSFGTDTEAVRWVDQVVIPGMTSYVDSQISQAMTPNFIFPLSVDLLTQAFPTVTYISATNTILGWQKCRELIIKYFSLAEIFLKADNTSEEYLKKSNEYRRLGELITESLKLSLKGTVGLIPGDLGGGMDGPIKTLIIKLRKNRNYCDNEYGYYG